MFLEKTKLLPPSKDNFGITSKSNTQFIPTKSSKLVITLPVINSPTNH